MPPGEQPSAGCWELAIPLSAMDGPGTSSAALTALQGRQLHMGARTVCTTCRTVPQIADACYHPGAGRSCMNFSVFIGPATSVLLCVIHWHSVWDTVIKVCRSVPCRRTLPVVADPRHYWMVIPNNNDARAAPCLLCESRWHFYLLRRPFIKQSHSQTPRVHFWRSVSVFLSQRHLRWWGNMLLRVGLTWSNRPHPTSPLYPHPCIYA